MTKVSISRKRGAEILVSGCRGVGESGCRGVGVSGCRGVGVSGCRGVGVSGCRGAGVCRKKKEMVLHTPFFIKMK